jgi:hypothetical protein
MKWGYAPNDYNHPATDKKSTAKIIKEKSTKNPTEI